MLCVPNVVADPVVERPCTAGAAAEVRARWKDASQSSGAFVQSIFKHRALCLKHVFEPRALFVNIGPYA